MGFSRLRVRTLSTCDPHHPLQALGHGETLTYAPWPVADEALLTEDTINLPVQVCSGASCRARAFQLLATQPLVTIRCPISQLCAARAAGTRYAAVQAVVMHRILTVLVALHCRSGHNSLLAA
jgi:leucyl-tRNA synthetase